MSKLSPEARDFATPRNFARLLNYVPAKKRKEIAAEQGYDFNARKLRFDPHLRAWVLFGLTNDETMRDMHAAVNDDPLYRLNGAGIDISVGGLSHAHATRPYEALQDVLMEALARIEAVPKSKSGSCASCRPTPCSRLPICWNRPCCLTPRPCTCLPRSRNGQNSRQTKICL